MMTSNRSNAAERKREQIRQAARQVFEARGYSGASMQLVANAANVSVGCIYLYFKNKEELALASLGITESKMVYDALKVLKKLSQT